MMQNGFLRSKRGSYVYDMLWLVVIIFVLGIAAVVGKVLVSELTVATDEMPLPAEVGDTIHDVDDGYVGAWDFFYLFAFVILVGMLWYSSWIIDAAPIFFIIMIVVTIIFTVVNMLLSTVFDDLFSNNGLSDTASQFVIIPFMMNHIVIIMIVVAVITGVLLYAKRSMGVYE